MKKYGFSGLISVSLAGCVPLQLPAPPDPDEVNAGFDRLQPFVEKMNAVAKGDPDYSGAFPNPDGTRVFVGFRSDPDSKLRSYSRADVYVPTRTRFSIEELDQAKLAAEQLIAREQINFRFLAIDIPSNRVFFTEVDSAHRSTVDTLVRQHPALQVTYKE
ncbi:MAG: hypothetical protein DI637_07360 [Citromicrobium sp.]|nr:MAG: hypothetical protein DI637_07360 [Citromicrobium sp.]